MITIYALKDPSTGRIRYVGKTARQLNTRLRAHINRAAGQKQIKSANWICSLLEQGLHPEALTLEQVESDWEPAERFWIASLRALGADLLNMTIGGAATPGCKLSAEARAKVSAAAKRQFSDPAARQAAAEFARAQWARPGFRDQHVALLKAQASTPAYRLNQSEKKKALWKTEEFRTKVLMTKHETHCHVVGALSMWQRPEYRAKRDAMIDAKCAAEGRVRGVSFDKRRSKWVVQLQLDAARRYVDRFDHKEDAEAAARAALAQRC